MIKRRFYKHEHGEKDVLSGSSSSSDSELDAEASVDTEEEEDDDVVLESKKREQPCSSSSGYESEDSSGNEVNLDASGLPSNDDVSGGENYKTEKQSVIINGHNTEANKDAITPDVLDCVLKSKSVFKCKLCPRIVCLTEETLKAHLKSKRHARSEKLLREGRLKMMLNSDGEIEIEGETHQERHASTLALAQSNKNAVADNSKKNKGRQRQRNRLKKVQKTSEDLTSKNTKKSAKKSSKKRRKSDI